MRFSFLGSLKCSQLREKLFRFNDKLCRDSRLVNEAQAKAKVMLMSRSPGKLTM